MAMQCDVAISNYLNHLQIERGLSRNTLTSYARDLRTFSAFISENSLDYRALADDVAQKFEVFLKSQKLALSSINRTISAAKGFYKYLALESEVADPFVDHPSLKVPRKLPKALTIEEVSRLISAALHEGDPITLRDHAILELLYSSGARVSEVIGINISDLIKTDVGGEEVTSLKLRGKGSKERIVPLGSFAIKAIEDYIVRIRPALVANVSKSENALFLNQRGSRISRQSAWSIVLRAAETTGLTGRVSPHVFRHSYATHLLDGGADIRVVQELLGHASVTTTQIYTLITIDKVRESYSLAHPRAK